MIYRSAFPILPQFRERGNREFSGRISHLFAEDSQAGCRKEVSHGKSPLELIILSVKETYMDAQEVMHMTNYSKITALYSRLSVGDEDST